MIDLLPALLGASVVGITLGLLGSGGSILCVPLLVYVVGRGEKQAIVESLAIVGLIALFSAVRAARKGGVRWRAILVLAPSTMLGAAAGGVAAAGVSGSVQLVLLAVLMLISAVVTLRSGRARADDRPRSARPALLLSLAGFGVGVITGTLGVGGGFLIVPVLIVLAGLPHRAAVGTSLGLISVNAGVGLGATLLARPETQPDWAVVGIFTAGGVVGAVVGAAIGGRIDQKAFKRVFAVFLLILGVLMIVREVAAHSGDAYPVRGAPGAPSE